MSHITKMFLVTALLLGSSVPAHSKCKWKRCKKDGYKNRNKACLLKETLMFRRCSSSYELKTKLFREKGACFSKCRPKGCRYSPYSKSKEERRRWYLIRKHSCGKICKGHYEPIKIQKCRACKRKYRYDKCSLLKGGKALDCRTKILYRCRCWLTPACKNCLHPQRGAFYKSKWAAEEKCVKRTLFRCKRQCEKRSFFRTKKVMSVHRRCIARAKARYKKCIRPYFGKQRTRGCPGWKPNPPCR